MQSDHQNESGAYLRGVLAGGVRFEIADEAGPTRAAAPQSTDLASALMEMFGHAAYVAKLTDWDSFLVAAQRLAPVFAEARHRAVEALLAAGALGATGNDPIGTLEEALDQLEELDLDERSLSRTENAFNAILEAGDMRRAIVESFGGWSEVSDEVQERIRRADDCANTCLFALNVLFEVACGRLPVGGPGVSHAARLADEAGLRLFGRMSSIYEDHVPSVAEAG